MATTTRSSVDRRQGLAAFFSADLVNSTEYKPRNLLTWPQDFQTMFFDRFGKEFTRAVDEVDAEFAKPAVSKRVSRPRLWTIIGDELIYSDSVPATEEEEHYTNLAASVQAFVLTVDRVDQELMLRGLGVRGCVWTAGFPRRNKRLLYLASDPIPLIGPKGSLDAETGDLGPPRTSTIYDYMGPDMDLGFRLARNCSPGRVICSLDVAHFIALNHLSKNESNRVRVFLLGWQRLKGICGDNPYPLLYLNCGDRFTPRTPWEPEDDQTVPQVKRALDRIQVSSDASSGLRLDPNGVEGLAERLWIVLSRWLIKPYARFTPGDVPPDHEASWLHPESPELEDTVAIEIGGGKADMVGAAAAVIQEDVLNQIQIRLRQRPSEAAELRRVLRVIADSEDYREWDAGAQYAGLPFHVSTKLNLGAPERNRLAESLGLVNSADNQLMSKITTRDDLVFLTDGLWVPGDFRVFPFADESDLLAAKLDRLGWEGWANLVVDPCCGCGHNMLKYRAKGDTERYAFDVNTRALSYTTINCLLNGISVAHVGLNDIMTGLPSRLQARVDDRVLFIVNTPFSLEPIKGSLDEPLADTLPLSAGGGPYGWDKVRRALEAIQTFEESSGDARIRTVVLTYSLGNVSESRWGVPDYARELFGEKRVSWDLLSGEKLWRVNGKKEQANPMTLDRLSLRAEDRFYIRRPERRDEVRTGYKRLETALAEKGFSHLAYGLISITERE